MSDNFLREALERMRAAGLDMAEPVTDGSLVRCRIIGKRSGAAGSYIIHMDKFPVAWWRNWITDTSETYCAKSQDEMTPRERKQFKESMAAISRARDKDERKRHAEGAAEAIRIWNAAKPATDKHPYLTRKNVAPYGLRVDGRNALIIPVLNEEGHIQSLQRIHPKKAANAPEKPFLSGGRTKCGHYIIKAADGKSEGPLLIAEGYATGASLHMATGLEVWIAFSANNLLAVARLARGKYPQRIICICADYDIACNEKERAAYPDPGGVGVARAREAAQAVGAYIAIPPPIDGGKADFNDIHCRDGLVRVKDILDKALSCQPANVCPIPEGYRLVLDGKKPGLFYLDAKSDGTTDETRLGPPLEVLAMTRDSDDQNYGLMLKWTSPAGKVHKWAMPLSLLCSVSGEWLGMLADGGWRGNPACRKLIARYLSSVLPVRHIRCVSRTGWDGDCFVLPEVVYGNEDKTGLVLQSLFHGGTYQTGGKYEAWQELAGLCRGNSRLVFATACAFAGAFLYIAGMESGAFSFVGQSSSGKTTAVKVAASVWGSRAHVRNWRTTDNGLESVAALHNDNLLILDEVSQAPARVLNEAVYMLCNGQGKSRSGKDGMLRRPQCWRVLVISNGEQGLADKLAEDGRRPKAGQEVRFVDIPVDKSHIAELHGHDDAGQLARQLDEISSMHYGHAGRMFLEKLTDPQTLAREKAGARQSIEQYAKSFCPDGADPQVLRVAMRFALVGYAGERAEAWGIVPAGFHAMDHAQTCFNDWLEQRGGAGAAEDMAVLEQVRGMIERYRYSRFYVLNGPADQRVIDPLGYIERDNINPNCPARYIILPTQFKDEFARGFSLKRAIFALSSAGWLERYNGRNQSIMRLPGLGSRRVYIIVLPEDKT